MNVLSGRNDLLSGNSDWLSGMRDWIGLESGTGLSGNGTGFQGGEQVSSIYAAYLRNIMIRKSSRLIPVRREYCHCMFEYIMPMYLTILIAYFLKISVCFERGESSFLIHRSLISSYPGVFLRRAKNQNNYQNHLSVITIP